MTMALLEARHLTKRYVAEHDEAVRDVSFDVSRGQIVVLLGPSGCGKTTILRLLAGFEQADRGSVVLDGKALTMTHGCPGAPGISPVHVRPERRSIGFVFQDYALFPHMTVLKNVMYGLKARPGRKQRAIDALRMVGMNDLADRKPHELSGGQQQRVALARSLAPSPKLILLDEPFSNLDASLRESTRAEVRRLLHDANMTAILVTHDQEEALSFGDQLAVMNKGRIVQTGTPRSVYEQPSTAFVAQFLGRTNLFNVDAQQGVADSLLGRLQLNRDVTGRVRISVRPEHLILELPRADLTCGQVISRDFRGHDLTYRVKVGPQTVLVHTDHRCLFGTGDQVAVVPTQRAVVVDDDANGESVV